MPLTIKSGIQLWDPAVRDFQVAHNNHPHVIKFNLIKKEKKRKEELEEEEEIGKKKTKKKMKRIV